MYILREQEKDYMLPSEYLPKNKVSSHLKSSVNCNNPEDKIELTTCIFNQPVLIRPFSYYFARCDIEASVAQEKQTLFFGRYSNSGTLF